MNNIKFPQLREFEVTATDGRKLILLTRNFSSARHCAETVHGMEVHNIKQIKQHWKV